jgi:hypothetical protein
MIGSARNDRDATARFGNRDDAVFGAARWFSGALAANAYDNFSVKFSPLQRHSNRALLLECPLFQAFRGYRPTLRAIKGTENATSKEKVNHWLFSQAGCESTRQRVTSPH